MATVTVTRDVMHYKPSRHELYRPGGEHGQARAEAAGRGGTDPGRAAGPLPGGAAGGHGAEGPTTRKRTVAACTQCYGSR